MFGIGPLELAAILGAVAVFAGLALIVALTIGRPTHNMVRHWQDKSRQCPVCGQLHHFIYAIEPGPGVVYGFECPVTKQLSDLRASEYVKETTILLDGKDAPLVPAVAKLSH